MGLQMPGKLRTDFQLQKIMDVQLFKLTFGKNIKSQDEPTLPFDNGTRITSPGMAIQAH